MFEKHEYVTLLAHKTCSGLKPFGSKCLAHRDENHDLVLSFEDGSSILLDGHRFHANDKEFPFDPTIFLST